MRLSLLVISFFVVAGFMTGCAPDSAKEGELAAGNTFRVKVQTKNCDSKKTDTCDAKNAKIAITGVFKVYATDANGYLELPASLNGQNQNVYMSNKPSLFANYDDFFLKAGSSCIRNITFSGKAIVLDCTYDCSCPIVEPMTSCPWDYTTQRCTSACCPQPHGGD